VKSCTISAPVPLMQSDARQGRACGAIVAQAPDAESSQTALLVLPLRCALALALLLIHQPQMPVQRRAPGAL
jgi:hypothetical protein